MTKKGGIVVSPRPTTTRGGSRAGSAAGGRVADGQEPVTAGEGNPRRADFRSFGPKDCVTIVTKPER
jgi:hypothetical protein